MPGFIEFMNLFGGQSFNRGLYRVHSERTGVVADRLIASVHPAMQGEAYCFAYDWMGCQFALDAERLSSTGEPLILFFDAATGEVLEVDRSFRDFHEIELVEATNNPLAEAGFLEWVAANPGRLPLALQDCVGYAIPLFLGGSDTVDNMEVTDIEVYWSLNVQMLVQTQSLPSGAKISGVKIQE